MDSLVSKVSYVNGLIDGLEINKESKEGKVICEIVQILNLMASELKEVKDSQEEMDEYLNALDEDLSDLEDEFYDEDEDFTDDYDDIEDFVDIDCPNCGETVYIDASILDNKEEITCPNCNNHISLGCGCDCCHDECED